MRSVVLMAGVLGLSACSDKLPPNLAMSEKEFEYRTELVTLFFLSFAFHQQEKP